MKKTFICLLISVFCFATGNLFAQWAQITVHHNGGAQVYNIPTSGLINWQSWHNCSTGPRLISTIDTQGWTWADNLPAGTVVTSVEVNISFDFSGTAAPQAYFLNGVSEGSSPGAFNINGSCVPDYKVLTLPGTNYIVGGQNTFSWKLGAYTFTIMGGEYCSDADGDGYNDQACGGDDCDDNDATIFPGAPELCDGIDNNCDGNVDEGLIDTDGDGLCDEIDACPNDPNNDADEDGVCGDVDNCPATSNADQADMDEDGLGDVCDDDIDGDGFENGCDSEPKVDNYTYTGYNDLPESWKCGNNKVYICHGSNNPHTNCVNKNAVQAHLTHGDYLGPCTSCGGQNMISNPNNGSVINSDHSEAVELELFPNPAANTVNVHMHGIDGEGKLTIFDQFGKTIWSQQLEEGQHALSLDLTDGHFVNGIYFVHAISNDGHRIARRLVIAK